jgi:hypothetical protein
MDLLVLSLLLLPLLAACFLILQSRRIATLKAALGEAEAKSADLGRQCEALRAECRALREDPPMPSDRRLADHLGRLGERLGGQAEDFEQARIKSALPLMKIAEMAAASRVVTRKPRLERLQADLETANAELARLTDHHVGVLGALGGIIDALSRLDAEEGAGRKACGEIERCVGFIAVEENDEAWHGGILHEPTADFRLSLAMKDRARERARSEREEQRRAADIAFNRHKLPPLTSIEKFRALRSFGRRDGVG